MKEHQESNDAIERRPRDQEEQLREQEKQRQVMQENSGGADAPVPDDGVVRDATAEREVSSPVADEQRQQLDTDYDLKPALQKQAKGGSAAAPQKDNSHESVKQRSQ